VRSSDQCPNPRLSRRQTTYQEYDNTTIQPFKYEMLNSPDNVQFGGSCLCGNDRVRCAQQTTPRLLQLRHDKVASAPFKGALRICLHYLDRPTCGCRLRDASRCTPADYPTSHSGCITTHNDANRQAHTKIEDTHTHERRLKMRTPTTHAHTHTHTHTNVGSTRAGNVSKCIT